jgi:hypothetical protein
MKKLLVIFLIGMIIVPVLGMDQTDTTNRGKLKCPGVARKLDFSSPTTSPTKTPQPASSTRPPQLEIARPESLEEILLFPERELPQTRIGKWWKSIDQKKKDAIELLGLLGVDLGVEVYRYFSGNDLLTWLVGYAVGKHATRVTDKYPFWKRLSVASVGWCLGFLPYLILNYDPLTFDVSFMMYIVHTIFAEYAKKTGRMNITITNFREMPNELQRELMEKVLA